MLPGSTTSSSPSGAVWRGAARIKGSSEALQMVVLTSSLVGIQYVPVPLGLVYSELGHASNQEKKHIDTNDNTCT